MSLTSYRAAPPRDSASVVWSGYGECWCSFGSGSGLAARRRPTLPRLEAQYHGRWGVSRPSSGWDRVWRPRDGHRATKADPPMCPGLVVSLREWALCAAWCCVRRPFRDGAVMVRSELDRAIRTARLRRSPGFHLRPIDVVVFHGPRGDLVWRGVSRLDAFSGYPVRAWLPGGAAGATTGAPEARPSRSSRTGDGASQVSCTHGR